ncbi:uncharacterized protein L3040_002327 [Drepanopeziza brunnea f. sp. 'multigermtubi']|uniref:Peroxin 11C n=1 Tax=Marssonina brunnea f. sp. multigermtubi (strain MB_m1) TaxID=1072389 RepID=K1WQS4_MARBU|nr:peroxin 11C [Drepanopeziza brunnea f. sp. 'multigermtubi' MB_m1]EKD19995.1 peroxin 11C [Drepanopeziza brunnea f. sp. 'multigermtubi' MB_m1]KAJ5050444.1 hypothetical protein L3040_002327 [Drepanopeziza brunnea f. sp. 'multigermtubi']
MSEISGIPAADTLPEKAIPISVPVPIPIPREAPSLATLRSWLPLYLKSTDRVLDRLARILQSPSQTDTLLQALCYTSLLASTISLPRIHNSIGASARSFIEKALALPPTTAPASAPPHQLPTVSQRLKSFSNLLSDVRIFARLGGLLQIYNWGKQVCCEDDGDGIVRAIVAVQVAVNVASQSLENMAYLSSKGVGGWDGKRQERAWLWSSRFWATHVGLEVLKEGRERLVWERERVKGKGEGDGKEEAATEERAWREKWWRGVVMNAAFAPLTLHWGLENGLLSEFWVGVLGSIAGVTGMREVWRKSGELG